MKKNEHEKNSEAKKPEPEFMPNYNPEENVDEQLKKFIQSGERAKRNMSKPPYCPKCGTPYEEGSTVCKRCKHANQWEGLFVKGIVIFIVLCVGHFLYLEYIYPVFPVNPIIGAILGVGVLIAAAVIWFIICWIVDWDGIRTSIGISADDYRAPPPMTDKEYFANLTQAEEQGKRVAKLLKEGWSIEAIVEAESLELPSNGKEVDN